MTSAMRLRIAVVLAVALAAALAGPAGAGFVPAWSYLSPALRASLAAKSGGSLYLPARTPLFYRYRSGASVSNGRLTVTFRNRARVRAGLWRWTGQTFRWQAIPVGANVACATWKRPDQTLQIDGNKVFWSGTAAGGTAWRCVTDRRGRRVVLAASAGRNLGAAGLATVVASGLDVSRRTSAVNVSLAVRPSAIHRGGSVLVSGVAGGCTSGDTVTILSRAFPATHEFAGVPAALAEVGSAGRFSVKVRIPASRAPGRYQLTARCGGGNLGASAFLRVI
jgi:hypothetical protein